jgi:molecular chaperone DnaK (HSP70)
VIERKAIADGMSKKMMAFDRTCSKFTDTIQSPQGLKQASKPDMRSRLESLEGKVQSVFKDMEPGKGEKKAFESMSKTLESTLESIKALVEAIKSILPGMRQEGPSMAPANGPM